MHIVGVVSLDISFILYSIFYLPQLVRNFRYHKIKELSFGFHALLFLAAAADLYYGFGRIKQWQYCAVSVIMFTCLVIQHVQWLRYAEKTWHGSLQYWVLTQAVVLLLVGLVLVLRYQYTHPIIFIIAGWIERLGYWLYVLPQIIKNRRQHSARAISPIFVAIGILTAVLDTTSAWIFHWGSPSLYGAPISIGLHIWLLWQCFSERWEGFRIFY